MKVLMINVVCGIKSTGRICTDLASALEARGHDVKIAYGRDSVPEHAKKYAIRIGNKKDVVFHGIYARLFDAAGLGSKTATKRFIAWVEKYNPDIIHVHNLHGYYINLPILFEYIKKNDKCVIWTLHDCWSFTGHAGYCNQVGCEKWKKGCYSCPLKHEYPSSIIDRSKRNYEWKKMLFANIKQLTIVTPSVWLANLTRQSFLNRYEIEKIPNGIEIEHFKTKQSTFRQINNLVQKIMLLGVAYPWSKRKGLEDFIKLADILDERFIIVLVGLEKKQIRHLPPNIIGLKAIKNVNELVELYSAADLFINPTYADNYPTVNIEALACGTPVITYNTGGSGEAICTENGKVFATGDLQGIANFLMKEYREGMFNVLTDCSYFDKSFMTRTYIDLYNRKMERRP